MSLPGIAESLLLTSMSHTGAGSGDSEGSAASSSEGLYLIVGLASGVYQRTRIDTSTGALSDTRSRFLGSKPVKLFNVTVQHKKAVLALTTRPWLSYNYQSRHFVTPLSYESLDFASNFQSEQCNEGIVAISGNTLRIISVEKLGDLFNQQSLKLTYTPRRVVTHPNTNYLIAIETDHNEHPEPVRQEIKAAVDNTIRDAGGDPDELNAEGAQVAPTRGPIPQGPGFWGSRITVIDTVDMNVLSYIELENNEAAFSICTCVFKDRATNGFMSRQISPAQVAHRDMCCDDQTECFGQSTRRIGHQKLVIQVVFDICVFHQLISCLNFSRASRMRDLIVPSGNPVSVAISLCDRSPK